MRLSLAAAALLACGVVLAAVPSWAGETVGGVTRTQGSGALTNPAGSRSLVVAAPVEFLDVITTGPESRAEIRFNDGGVLTLGSGTTLTIDGFVHDPGKARGGSITLRQGVFRMITAAGPGPANLTVKTPLASIGIRGTDFWGEQSADRLRLLLLAGGPIELTTPAGTQILREAGTVVEVTRAAPIPTAPVKLAPEVIAEAAKTVSFE